MKIVLLTLVTAVVASADNRIANHYSCVSASKNTLEASAKFGEIVVKNNRGKMLRNIDGTTAKVTAANAAGVYIEFINEDQESVLTIDDKVSGITAYFGEKYICSKRN